MIGYKLNNVVLGGGNLAVIIHIKIESQFGKKQMTTRALCRAVSRANLRDESSSKSMKRLPLTTFFFKVNKASELV